MAASARAALEAIAARHGLPDVPESDGALRGFRLRARLAVRGRRGSPKIGLFETDSHRVVHIPNCSVQHPLINHTANAVRRAMVDTKTTSYSDTAHLGLVRHLQLVVERASQTVQLVIVGNGATAEPLADCLNLIRERLGADLHSLWYNANVAQNNIILGPYFERWHGPEALEEHFGGPAIYFPPGAFGQNNLDLAEAIIAYVRTLIPPQATLAEYYAGVGAFGLSLLPLLHELRLNELAPHSLAGLNLGLAQLSAKQLAKVSVFPGAAGEALGALDGAQVVLADPPRKGLDPPLLEYIAKNPPERFIYVSCGLESFGADAERLVEGGLSLQSLRAFNLFPFTEHVETVACFERRAAHRSAPRRAD